MTFKSTIASCSNCNLRELCLPTSLSSADIQRLEAVFSSRLRIPQGGLLFSSGTPFTALYNIRSGFFKTCVSLEDGREQVTGFQMAGEIIGLDGIVNEYHNCNAVALEDAEVCVMPYAEIERLSQELPELQRHMHKIMSGEIVRENAVMMLLGSMSAEERLAAFLLNLVKRLRARGFSSSELLLRMTREEIGSYLGLTLNTVSRVFSKFREKGIVNVKQRYVQILKIDELELIYDSQSYNE